MTDDEIYDNMLYDDMAAATEEEGIVAPPEEPGYFSETMSNVPSSAQKYVTDIVDPIVNWRETKDNMKALGKGLYDKLITPGEQKSEAIPDAIGAYMKDRYWDNPAEHFKKDPVGMIGDFAGLAMGGGTMAAKGAGLVNKTAGNALQKAANVAGNLDPLNALTTGTSAIRSALINPDKHIKTIREVMNIPTTAREGGMKGSLDRAKTIADYELLPDYKSVDKRNALMEQGSDKIDTIIKQKELDNALVDSSVIRDFLEQRLIGNEAVGPRSATPIKNEKYINKQLKEWDARVATDNMAPSDANALKRTLQQEASKQYGKKSDFKGDTQKSKAYMLRKEIDKLDPDIRKTNAELSRLIDVEKTLLSNAGRETRGLPNLLRPLAKGSIAGAVTQNPIVGGAVAAGSVFNTPTRKLKRAIKNYKLGKKGVANILTGSNYKKLAGTEMARLMEKINKELEQEQ